MPVSVVRLRRWLVIAMIVVCVMVGGSYLYLRHRVTNALKQALALVDVKVLDHFIVGANRAMSFAERGLI